MQQLQPTKQFMLAGRLLKLDKWMEMLTLKQEK